MILRIKAEMENLRRRTEQDVEKAHKFALEKFVNELLPVIDSLDRALEVADKANPDNAAMIEGIELTLKSMLDVVRKFGVEVIADTDVPLDPNVHQAIAMVESEDVEAGKSAGRDAERVYPERPYHPCCDGNRGESESVICRPVVPGGGFALPGLQLYSAILSRSGLTGRTFTCLIILSCTSRISISYCSMRTRVPAAGISSSASRIIPFMVRASSSGRCQLKALLSSRMFALPSISTEPSFLRRDLFRKRRGHGGGKVSNNLFQNIFDRHQPLNIAILIDHQTDFHFCYAGILPAAC